MATPWSVELNQNVLFAIGYELFKILSYCFILHVIFIRYGKVQFGEIFRYLHDTVSPVVGTFYIFGIVYIVVCGYQWKLKVFCVIACSMTAQTMVVFLDPVRKGTLFHLSIIFQFGIFKF